MSSLVFFAVILAAIMHAVWNAIVKGGNDKHLSMAAIVLGHLPFALIVLPFTPLPAVESLPYLFAGIALHAGYQLLLLNSYRFGDLTQVYPIARGSAPLIVAFISVSFLGVVLQWNEFLAVVIIGAGIISMSLVRQQDGERNPKAAMLALATGCFIASYSLVDGLGARLAGTALGFYGWLTIGNAILCVLYMGITKPHVLKELPIKAKKNLSNWW